MTRSFAHRTVGSRGGVAAFAAVVVAAASLSLSEVVAAAAPTADARLVFAGHVCSLLTSKQVASVTVTPLKCSDQKPIKGSGGTLYYGNWGGTGLAPHLSVSIDAHTDATG